MSQEIPKCCGRLLEAGHHKEMDVQLINRLSSHLGQFKFSRSKSMPLASPRSMRLESHSFKDRTTR